MRTLKYSIGSALASGVILLAPAAPVAADEVGNNNNSSTNTSEVTTKTSTNTGIQQNGNDGGKQIAVLGNCSGVFFSRVDLDQSTDLSNGGNGYEGQDPNSVVITTNQNASSTQSATGITFSPDCSVHNVTQAAGGQGGGAVLAANTSAAVASAQVSAPKGGVGAGVGGAVGSSLTAVLGIAGSLGSFGLGLRRFGN
jgi:hypothetical protein